MSVLYLLPQPPIVLQNLSWGHPPNPFLSSFYPGVEGPVLNACRIFSCPLKPGHISAFLLGGPKEEGDRTTLKTTHNHCVCTQQIAVFLFLSLKNYFMYLFICLRLSVCRCAAAHIRRSELGLPFHLVGPRNRAQFVRLVDNRLYSLSHTLPPLLRQSTP